MQARLVPMTPGAGPTIPVQRPVVLVGRHPESDVRIDLPQISRRHCCLALAYDRLVIRDLGSRNGLWVNGRRLEESLLQAGDEVAIGALLYRVEDLDAPGPSTTIPAALKAKPAPAVGKPPSLPSMPLNSTDSDADLIPLEF